MKAKPLRRSPLKMTLNIAHNSGTMRKLVSITRSISLAFTLSCPDGTVCQAGQQAGKLYRSFRQEGSIN